MASYNPPTENITQFNTSLFNQPEETLSQQEADLLYLSKKNTDTSTAPLTTFNNQVDTKGGLSVGVQGVAGGLLNVNRRMRVNDANGNATGYLDITYGSGAEAVYTSQSLSLAQTFHRFYNCASGSATPVLRLEVGDTTKIPNGLEVGTNGAGSITGRGGIGLYDISAPYQYFLQLYPTGTGMNYIMNNNGAAVGTTHNFTAYETGIINRVAFRIGYSNVDIIDGVNLNARLIKSTSTNSAHTLFDNMIAGGSLTIGSTTSTNTIQGQTTFSNLLTASTNFLVNTIQGVLNTGTKNLYTSLTGTLNIGQATTTLINVKGPTTFDLDTTFTSRLNMNASSYSFPFASSQSLGYYLKATGTGTSVVTATPTTILTTASIPIGVWRIDFSVQNVVGAAGAGTITQAQSFVSTTLNGGNGTAVPFTGSLIRSHIAEVYGNNDIQLITSSFNYQQSTAGVLYLNIVRSFSTGTYSFTGELSITRIA